MIKQFKVKQSKILILSIIFISLTTYSYLDYGYLEKLTYYKKPQINVLENCLDEYEKRIQPVLNKYDSIVISLIKKHALKNGCHLGIPSISGIINIMNKTNISTLYTIDAYYAYGLINQETLSNCLLNDSILQSKKITFSNQAYLASLDILYYRNKHLLNEYKNTLKILRLFPYDAAELFLDNELDFVYLGFNHSDDNTIDNLHSWYRKVRKGGIIAGFFYGTNQSTPQLVKRFFVHKKNKLLYCINDPKFWWIIKS